MTRRMPRVALALALVLVTAPLSLACVGKTLQVGVVPTGEDRLLTRILSILVNERTGTSVRIREFGSFAECFTALEKDDIDVVVAFTGQGLAEVAGETRAASAEAVLAEVREVFNTRYNLVWLEPWGVADGGRWVKDDSGRPLPTQAAPLVRKDTLKEFPALARLINKMAGRLAGTAAADLMKKADGGDPDRAARDYLKAEKLI